MTPSVRLQIFFCKSQVTSQGCLRQEGARLGHIARILQAGACRLTLGTNNTVRLFPTFDSAVPTGLMFWLQPYPIVETTRLPQLQASHLCRIASKTKKEWGSMDGGKEPLGIVFFLSLYKKVFPRSPHDTLYLLKSSWEHEGLTLGWQWLSDWELTLLLPTWWILKIHSCLFKNMENTPLKRTVRSLKKNRTDATDIKHFTLLKKTMKKESLGHKKKPKFAITHRD